MSNLQNERYKTKPLASTNNWELKSTMSAKDIEDKIDSDTGGWNCGQFTESKEDIVQKYRPRWNFKHYMEKKKWCWDNIWMTSCYFCQSMDEFVEEVSDLVDLTLNVYLNNVQMVRVT